MVSGTLNFIRSKKVYICGCVKNCANFLQKIFGNIDQIINLFDDYKIVIAHDTLNDNTLDILNMIKLKYKLEIIYVAENNNIHDFSMRTQRISNARNKLLEYIRKDNQEDFQYFIMMDMDDVCAGYMNVNVLKQYLDKEVKTNDKFEGDWDALSFNKQNYPDIWALSLDPYVFSCWHFPGGYEIVNKMTIYLLDKLNKLNKNELMTVRSAFNGFSIYRKNKFLNCNYDWQIKTSFSLFSNDEINRNENALGKRVTLDKSYHQIINPQTDCEHRHFHLSAIKKNNAKIRISPLCLFTD